VFWVANVLMSSWRGGGGCGRCMTGTVVVGGGGGGGDVA
jgi:hypothetical protein